MTSLFDIVCFFLMFLGGFLLGIGVAIEFAWRKNKRPHPVKPASNYYQVSTVQFYTRDVLDADIIE